EVEVRAARDLAGIAAERDGLAAAHPVAEAPEQAVVVLIEGKIAVGVLDGNYVPPLVRPVGENDVPVAHGADGRALVDGEVDAVVAAAGAEPARDEAGDGG